MKVLSFDTSHPRRTVVNLTWENEEISLLLDISSSQQDKLLFAIDHLLTSIKASLDKLDGLVIGIGPGSFTGLRIGLSLAKGFAWAKSLPLYPVSSLETLALSFPWQCLPEATVVASTDARMKKLYACVYQKRQKILPESDIFPQDLANFLVTLAGPFWFVGENPYLEIFRALLGESHIHTLPLWISPHVLRDHGLAQSPLSHEEMMTLEPLYLRKSEAENTTPTKTAGEGQ
ncbi:MAG: tRNA (adenosine(37)-N6)-threonylcarbamoyltransferase complex dimerization subunit type 1 TsaB [Brevinematales bacterium]|nr:tRNA (adenosine(37)-N6)-threonylcarbamoyltransferase complex dimerization subunit type 1 TsaB [Brevinematales bacterium]